MSGGSAVLALPDSGTDDQEVIVPKRVRSKTRKILVDDNEPYIPPPQMDIAELQMEDSLRQQGATEQEIANMREMIRRRANRPEPMG